MKRDTGLVIGERGLVGCQACGREIRRTDAEIIDTDRGVLVVCKDGNNCEEGE